MEATVQEESMGTYEHPRQIDKVIGTCKIGSTLKKITIITAPLADAVANFSKADPCIYGIVGPSGSNKNRNYKGVGGNRKRIYLSHI